MLVIHYGIQLMVQLVIQCGMQQDGNKNMKTKIKLGESVSKSLRTLVWNSVNNSLWGYLSDSLWDSVSDSLGNPVGRSVRGSLCDSLSNSINNRL